MALVKCRECGKEVSSQAQKCPSCGKNLKMSTPKRIFWLLFLFVILGAVFSAINKDHPPSNQSKTSSKKETKSAPKLSAAAQRIKSEHPSWSNEACISISKKKIYLGMNKEQVIAAWGEPKHINKETGSSIEQELYWYGEVGKGTVLHFINGHLKYVNESK
jgi:hypothetical protein